MEYGILCVLPVITILVIAVTTEAYAVAMTCGLAMAAMILGKGRKALQVHSSTTLCRIQQ